MVGKSQRLADEKELSIIHVLADGKKLVLTHVLNIHILVKICYCELLSMWSELDLLYIYIY